MALATHVMPQCCMNDRYRSRCGAALAACLKFRLKVTASEESWLFLFMLVSVKPKPFEALSAQFRLFCTRGKATYLPEQGIAGICVSGKRQG